MAGLAHGSNLPESLPAGSSPTPGQPQEHFEVEEPGNNEDGIQYPTGAKLVVNTIAVMLSMVLLGLDLTIVAVVVPSLTDHFKTLDDIGWYSAIYGVFLAVTTFLFGKLYTVFKIKHLFLITIGIFELGSLCMTVAVTSKMFISGRALAGTGASGMFSGAFLILAQCFPKDKRPIWLSIAGASQGVAMVGSPILGGVLVDKLSWRACFGINLPLGVAVMVMLVFGFKDVTTNTNTSLPLKEKLKRIDLLGTALVIPAITCLLVALQWGGMKYGWGNGRIIALLLVFVIFFGCFAWLQFHLQDKATVPPRIFKSRSVLGACFFGACVNGALAVTEFYIAIYFQGVKGYSASKAGIFILPMLTGLIVATMIAGAATTKIGYYTPFMLATSVLAPIASGLLTTVSIDDNPAKVLCLLGFLGIGVGFGLLGPMTAVQTVLPFEDLSIGVAVLGFGGGLGSALFVAASATLFQNRLTAEIKHYAPGSNVTQISTAGLTEIRHVVDSDRLRDVLLGYDKAVTQTLYLPLALTIATLIGSGLTEWRSVKKKQA